MRNNGKGLMAVFGVMLMLVYILPGATKYGSGHGNDVVRGKMGKLAIYQSDLSRYTHEWEFLNRNVYTLQDTGPSQMGMPGEQQWEAIGQELGPTAVEQIRQHPDMYPLMVEEARQMGVGVSPDQINSLLQNRNDKNSVRTPDGQGNLVSPSELADTDRQDMIRQCLVDFLLVQNAFDRAASTIKASQPVDQNIIATRAQSISLNMVEFSDTADLTKVPDPTPQQMQEQFEKYKDIDALTANVRDNPFDFGYKYPDRIKLQYISVPRSALEAAALRARNKNNDTRFNWDLAAYRYYQAHQSLYATTQPANALALTPETKKTIRPFQQVTDEARQSVLQDDADKLALAIRQKITSQMGADYLAWKNNASPTTQPAASPPTAMGVPYDSPEYLNRLALHIQQNYDVLPSVISPGDWQTALTLDALPGISGTVIDDPDMRPLPFALYAIDDFSAFLSPDADATNALSLLEPSAAMKNDQEDFYEFRILAAEKSHAPASISEVADQVRKDLKTQAAYALADSAADKYLAAARAAHSVTAPARSAGQTIIVAGPINYGQNDPIAGYANLSPMALRQFSMNAFDLLAAATASNPHPIGKIPVQLQGRVLVGEVTNIQSMWPSTLSLLTLQSDAGRDFRLEQQNALRGRWFTYSDLISRTHYQEKKAPEQTPVAPDSGPNPPPL